MRTQSTPASEWVRRWAREVPARKVVLDVACGVGRHTRLFLELGHPVVAVDVDMSRLDPVEGVEIVQADLENDPWPFTGRRFAGVVVANYLHRPLLPAIAGAVAAGGVVIYETFAAGNERFGRPSNPDYLLRPGELLRAFADLRVLAYEDIVVEGPRGAALQRICARRD